LKEAVEPLKKATELDPKERASVVSAGRHRWSAPWITKQVGNKLEVSGAAGGLWRLIRKP